MSQNRIFLLIALLVAGLLWLYGTYFATPRPMHHLPAGATSPNGWRVEKTDDEWRSLMPYAQYRVTRDRGTEWPNSSQLAHEHRSGTYVCAACKNLLFASKTKFESGTGWPSFYQPVAKNAIYTEADRSRTEVRCSVCDAHLGHVFNDGPEPTGLRYCMNGVAMSFAPTSK